MKLWLGRNGKIDHVPMVSSPSRVEKYDLIRTEASTDPSSGELRLRSPSFLAPDDFSFVTQVDLLLTFDATSAAVESLDDLLHSIRVEVDGVCFDRWEGPGLDTLARSCCILREDARRVWVDTKAGRAVVPLAMCPIGPSDLFSCRSASFSVVLQPGRSRPSSTTASAPAVILSHPESEAPPLRKCAVPAPTSGGRWWWPSSDGDAGRGPDPPPRVFASLYAMQYRFPSAHEAHRATHTAMHATIHTQLMPGVPIAAWDEGETTAVPLSLFRNCASCVFFWGIEKARIRNVRLRLKDAVLYDGPLAPLEHRQRALGHADLPEDVVVLHTTCSPLDCVDFSDAAEEEEGGEGGPLLCLELEMAEMRQRPTPSAAVVRVACLGIMDLLFTGSDFVADAEPAGDGDSSSGADGTGELSLLPRYRKVYVRPRSSEAKARPLCGGPYF
jgi:hypothetical protein